jgi:beta-glucanase (GH16 family)
MPILLDMRHQRAAAAIGIAAILSGSMLGATAIGASAATPRATVTYPPNGFHPSDQPAGNCGGEQYTKSDGSAYACSFDDEFNATSVDSTSWMPQLTSGSNFTSGKAPYKVCYVNNPNTISESGGYLHLSVIKTAAKFTCNGSNALKNFSTQYQGGELMTYRLFSQKYGRFEVNAKLPASTVAGLQETFWLWPDNPTLHGTYPGSGEIDFAEFYSQYANQVIPYIHYDYGKTTVNTTTNTNIVTNDYTCIIDPTKFNDYAVDWQPGRITLTYNGNVCLVDNYKPSNVSSPAPFDQPFFLTLTQALGVGTNGPTASTPIPATTLVDYARIWK